jgi:very-short-patch-repair endonuclease
MPKARRPVTDSTKRARKLREQQTKAESLLWSVIRAKRLCGLKFRRQYPVGPFFADFACIQRKIVVELDGSYHDYQYEDDLSRQRFLESQGWQVFRFANEDVLEDVEAVAISIATQLGMKACFGRRVRAISGMKSSAPSPGPESPTSPGGRGDAPSS